MTRSQPDNEDYRWLLDALGGPGSGEPSSALARPSADKPELFIPLRSSAVSATALRRYHDGRTATDRKKTTAALVATRAGLLRHAPGDHVSIGPFRLLEQLAETLDEPRLEVAITLGPRRRNRKPVLQLIRPDGASIGFAKVGWSPFTRSLVENEAVWLDRLDGKMPASIELPRVLATLEQEDRLIVVTSPLETSPRSGLDGRLDPRQVVRMARSLGSTTLAFADLPYLAQFGDGRLGEVIDTTTLVQRHASIAVEVGLWHGDLTPWNTSTSGGVTRVWDWEFADDERPVGFDMLHGAFERIRRSAPNNEAEALRSMCREAASLLEPLGQHPDAVVDLYLCELIQREARLRGEGWAPTDLGPLESHAVTLLNERLR